MSRAIVPTKLKVLKGTDQPCRVNDMEPEPSQEGIDPPKNFKDRHLEKWLDVYGKLKDCRVMTNIDIDNVESYVNAYWQWYDATEECKERMMVVDDKGIPMLNPMHKVQNQYFNQMISLMRDLGMTPASRTKVKTVGKEKDATGFNGL